MLYALDYNVSIAVWVGVIALMGLDAETGVFMLLYLELAHEEAQQRGQLQTRGQLQEAIIHGAVKRVRPKAMPYQSASDRFTVMCTPSRRARRVRFPIG